MHEMLRAAAWAIGRFVGEAVIALVFIGLLGAIFVILTSDSLDKEP